MTSFKQSKANLFNIVIITLLLLGYLNSGNKLEITKPATRSSIQSEIQNNFTLISSTIDSSSDDAEEEVASGDVNTNSTDLEMIDDNGTLQTVGLRFNNITIPHCAPINSAYIQFTAKFSGLMPNVNPCNLTLFGEDADNALTFSTTDFDVSSRPKTMASEAWSPQDWLIDTEAGVMQQTVDISTIIQEIVNREGFVSGNSIAIIIEGTGMRRAYSYDEQGFWYAPVLNIDYSPVFPDDDADGVCNANDQCWGPEPGTTCDDSDPTTYNDVITLPGCVCEGTPYDCPSLLLNYGDPCDDGNPETSNDIVQSNCVCAGSYDCPGLELNIGDPCDDGNPNTANDMVTDSCICIGVYDCPILQLNFGDACDDGISGTFNDIIVNPTCECMGTWECPTLMAGYGDPCDDGNPNTSSDMVDSTCTCVGLDFLCVKIVDSSDDAEEENVSGDISLGSNDLEMIDDNGTLQTIGLRFQNITIPQCAVIESASIQFVAKNSDNENPSNLTIFGEATVNSSTFSNEDYNISSRAKTSSSVLWSPVDWSSNDSGPDQQTVDISSIVQEIVNQVDFASGNSISFIIEGEGMRRAFSYNDSPDNAPELCIEFSADFPDEDDDGTCDANDLCENGPEPWTPCDDGDPNTPNDYIDTLCNCVGGFDCPDLFLNIGDSCDDGESGTYNDIIADSTCMCLGTWECETLMVGFGTPCDDLDSMTLYDAIDSTCNCVGIPFIDIGVANSNDDAEESPSGDMSLESNDLEMTFDDVVQTIGIRFANPNIPPCSVINTAYIQFTAKNSDNENPCNLQIFGEASDTAASYTNDDFNITNRQKTNSIVFWSPEEWSSNDDTLPQRTPDLSPILQEILNRPGFTDTSAIAFVIEGFGMRRAYSYDAGEDVSPKLYVEYLLEIPDADEDGVCDVNDLCPGGLEPGMICNDSMDITYNDTINANCLCVGTEYDCINIFANFFDPCDDGDPNTPNDYIDTLCNCVGGFDCPELFLNIGDPCDDGIPGTHSDMVDTSCVCVGIWDCEELMLGIGYPCDDGDSTTLDDFVDPNCDCIGSPTLYVQVATSSDDAEEKETTAMSLTSSDLELVDDATNQTVGIRFTNLNIPNGARIDTAFIQFTTDEVLMEPNECNLTIYGHDTDNAQTFVEVHGDISGRTKTSASVDWSPVEWLEDDEAGPNQQTPNLKTIVKEIVNRSGFNESSSLAFIIEGSGTRVATSYDGKPENAPILYIRYDLPLGNEAEISNREKAISIYPVPTSGNLNIVFESNSSGQIPIRILDLNGRLVFDEKRFVRNGENKVLIDDLNLENGIYFVQIEIDGIYYMKKIVNLK